MRFIKPSKLTLVLCSFLSSSAFASVFYSLVPGNPGAALTDNRVYAGEMDAK